MVAQVIRHAVEEAADVGGQLGDVGGVAGDDTGEVTDDAGQRRQSLFEPVGAELDAGQALRDVGIAHAAGQ